MPTCIAGFTTKKTVGQTLEGMDIKLLQSDADVTDFIVTDSTCQLRIRLRLIAKQVSDDIATVPDIVATLEVMMLKDELLRLPSQEMTPSEAVKRAVQFIQTWHATKQALHDQAEAIAK